MLSLHPNKGSRLSKKLDTLFWWILRLAPVLFIILHALSDNGTLYDLYQGIEGFAGELDIYNNIVFTTLEDLFGSSGILTFWAQQDAPIYYYFTYLVFIEIVHVFYDVIVFIPRLAHKWISNAVQDD